MNSAGRRAAFKRFLMTVWGLATLVLVFSVLLLAREMAVQGKDSLAAVKKETATSAAATPKATADLIPAKDIVLYFADASGRQLVPEPARIDYSESTVENCRKALELLIHGPRETAAPILPPATPIRAMYLLDDGELVVDFSMELERELRRIESAATEAFMAYGIAATLTQPALQGTQEVSVARVRFLIEGAVPGETFPAHIDLSNPIVPTADWVAAGGK